MKKGIKSFVNGITPPYAKQAAIAVGKAAAAGASNTKTFVVAGAKAVKESKQSKEVTVVNKQ